MRVSCLLRVRLSRPRRITSVNGLMKGKDLCQHQHNRVRDSIAGVLFLLVPNRVVMRGNYLSATNVGVIIRGTATVIVAIAASDLGISLKIVGRHFHRPRPQVLPRLLLLKELRENRVVTTVGRDRKSTRL